jgi:hypothetical protein
MFPCACHGQVINSALYFKVLVLMLCYNYRRIPCVSGECITLSLACLSDADRADTPTHLGQCIPMTKTISYMVSIGFVRKKNSTALQDCDCHRTCLVIQQASTLNAKSLISCRRHIQLKNESNVVRSDKQNGGLWRHPKPR